MKRILWILTLFLAVSLALTACGAKETPTEAPAPEPTKAPTPEPAAPEETGLPDLEGREVTIAIENAYLPFNYIDPDTGEPAGWDYEVWDEICTLLNCTPKYVEAAWEGMIQAVADRYFEIDCSCFSPNTERLENIEQIVHEYQIQGVVQNVLQYCHTYNIEAIAIEKRLRKMGIPALKIVTDYSEEDLGQIRTRIEAFAELLDENV